MSALPPVWEYQLTACSSGRRAKKKYDNHGEEETDARGKSTRCSPGWGQRWMQQRCVVMKQEGMRVKSR